MTRGGRNTKRLKNSLWQLLVGELRTVKIGRAPAQEGLRRKTSGLNFRKGTGGQRERIVIGVRRDIAWAVVGVKE